MLSHDILRLCPQGRHLVNLCPCMHTHTNTSQTCPHADAHTHNSCTKTPKSSHPSPSPHLQTEPFKLLSLPRQHALHVPMTHSPGSQEVSVSHPYPSCCSFDVPASFLTQEVSNRNRPTHLCVLTSILWNMSSPLIFPASFTSISCPQEGCLIHH